MAALTKQSPRTNEEASIKQASIGDMKGRWICDGLRVIRGEDEDWPQYLGRIEKQAADVDSALIRLNAGAIERELAATLEKGGKS
jgi:hypothetical protein